ncbi:hypothetical protein D7X33_04850 [Butyricicoccus sp. 1XD8-22]|nr:hypothetical protein D7X33_04850 [Butyricicoccus sp. 1XD8-22]
MDYDSCSVIQPAIMAAGWIGLRWRMGALPLTAIPPPTGWQDVASRLAASVSAVLLFLFAGWERCVPARRRERESRGASPSGAVRAGRPAGEARGIQKKS